jgi:hypothetical protein
MVPQPRNSDAASGRWERIGAVAVAAEAVMLLAGSGVLILGWFSGGASFSPGAIFVVAFGIALATGLLAVARALARGARWPIGAALTWQVLQGAVVLGSTGSRWWLVALLLLPVPVALAGVISAAVRARGRERAANERLRA